MEESPLVPYRSRPCYRDIATTIVLFEKKRSADCIAFDFSVAGASSDAKRHGSLSRSNRSARQRH